MMVQLNLALERRGNPRLALNELVITYLFANYLVQNSCFMSFYETQCS